MRTDNNKGISKDLHINSRYFDSKLNLNQIIPISKSTEDIAIFIDEKILPEINGERLEYKIYLKILDGVNSLSNYGKSNKLKTSELKSFVLIMSDLLFSNYNVNGRVFSLRRNEIKTKKRAIEFLNSLNQLEMTEEMKLKLLIDFVLNNYEKEKEIIKKSVMLSPKHIEKINQIDRKGFSAKVRFILDSYFAQNKTFVTEDDVLSGVSSDIIGIYYKLKEEILAWNKEIKFKAIKDFIIFSNYYRFLKLSFDKDKINLELSFKEDNPFKDPKAIIKEVKEVKEIKKINFHVTSYKEIEYALYLIKQSYENNNQEIYSYSAYNHSIHKLFNNQKRYDFPFNDKINKIPKNGIFVLFEKGEKFQNQDRIVYVGSNIKENRIPKMLNYIFKDGSRDNTHFRKNIGRTLLVKDEDNYIGNFKNLKFSKKLLNNWDMDLKEFNEEYSDDSKENKQIELVEEMVSQYIQDNFSYSVIEIDSKLKRSSLKNKIISSLSLSDEFKPSDDWLGNDSPREKIRKSGLWLEQHLYNRENQLNPDDVEFLEEIAKD